MAPRTHIRRRLTVLLVEDDEATRFALSTMLVREGYLVLGAPTAPDALDVVRGMTEPIDLVVLDLDLPETAMLALCARLKELRPSLPIIVCGGEAEPDEVACLSAQGVSRYLEKPVGPDELLAAVENALG